MSRGFEGSNISDMDAFRKKRQEAAEQAAQGHRAESYTDEQLEGMAKANEIAVNRTPAQEVERPLTDEEVLAIAHNVVKRYADKQELFNSFLGEHHMDASLESIEEFDALLERNKEIVQTWSHEDLRKYLQSYEKHPADVFKTHLLPAAERFIGLEEPLTLEGGIAIARQIVEKYAGEDALYKAFLEDKKRPSSPQMLTEFPEVLSYEKSIAESSPNGSLLSSLQAYSKQPDAFPRLHAFCRAQELIRRLGGSVQ